MEDEAVIKDTPKLEHELHKKYLLRFLKGIPSFLCSLDTNRVTILHFLIAGLDVLDELDTLSEDKKKQIIEWVYALQVLNDEDLVSGFQGSTTNNSKTNREPLGPYKWGHLAFTYSSLTILLILGDDLSRINRKAIIKSFPPLQDDEGCFTAARWGTEKDMRFVYCAACVSFMLNDWSGMNLDKTTTFIRNSITYEFGIGQTPGTEAHAGTTFCALATLALSNKLSELTVEQQKGITRWLLNRVEIGFNGRPNKPVDTCYSFWVGGALKILDAYRFLHNDESKNMVLATQDKYGGFSKWINCVPDPLHTYFGLAGLSLMGKDNLKEIYAPLNVTIRTYEHLKRLHSQWETS